MQPCGRPLTTGIDGTVAFVDLVMKTLRVNPIRGSGVALLLLLCGCSASGYSIAELADSINATRDVAVPVVVAGDYLKVTFLGRPEWNQEVRVRPDGSAAFLGLDDVKVVGLTLPEVDERLTKAYASVNTDSPVEKPLSVEIASAPAGVTTPPPGAVLVIGEVRTPGAVALPGRTMTLCEAIGAAGGHLKETANLRNTILVRRLASGEMRSWRLDADIYQWGALPAIYLQPRDIVFVPNTAIDEVNIWVDQYIRRMIPLPTLFPAQ